MVFSHQWNIRLANGISCGLQRFCKEILVAKLVNNENVLAIEGVQVTDEPKFCIVSEWMEHGDMHTYLKGNESADRVELLLGVVRGLNYLHSIEVVHGDLKSSNVLIDSGGNPRLTDFGLSSITRNAISANAFASNGKGTIRWRAPELLALSTKAKDKGKVKFPRPTKKSDTYSLAMVVIEIFTREHPFHPHRDEQVIILLAQGSRPDRPVHPQFIPEMWSLTRKCWKKNPKERPDIPEVLEKLEPGAERTDKNHWRTLLNTFSFRISPRSGKRSDTIR
ncbi:kinase-like protein [Thelephora ganbajun]|uniref:Kinase-like protein n=1 Tax=Thelephora ganbajun TaxID=370292 RepID=A0ACB6ZAW5_THEGA|nr:kinase-like protein [Thelephora ganbajun]